ncbi:MAG: XdhC /CoxI family-like protein [Rhizobiales bacterium 17-65-6]|nr:MAG: XdhC /CoxI family-like protein [Rhizobiales bacterium 17-65-6]
MTSPIDMFALMDGMKQKEQPFALATVVRTVSVTAAKAGAKALILPDGTVLAGWIGGGCARGATLKAAREALADGQPRLVSIQPEDLLEDLGVHAGETREGVRYVSNMCPSKGTMDIFVEPVLPRPELVVMGASPVAVALVGLAPQFGFSVTAAAPIADHAKFAGADRMTDGCGPRFVVVSTQGAGDLAALTAALGLEARHVAFVGSRRKAQTLSEKLRDAGIPQARLDALKAPAGLDLGAITPEEIALSILAELVLVRRRDQRGAAA